jgi:hypothetical protein
MRRASQRTSPRSATASAIERWGRTAHVVAEDGDELLAKPGALALVLELGAVPLLGLELQRDELAEELHHRERLAVGELARIGIEAAEVPEVVAVATEDGHRDVALEAVQLRRPVAAIEGIVDIPFDSARHPQPSRVQVPPDR